MHLAFSTKMTCKARQKFLNSVRAVLVRTVLHTVKTNMFT